MAVTNFMSGPGRQADVTDEEILNVFRSSEDPVLTTSEVAEGIGLGQRGTFDRLTQLVEDGVIESKKAGQASIWWLPD